MIQPSKQKRLALEYERQMGEAAFQRQTMEGKRRHPCCGELKDGSGFHAIGCKQGDRRG